MAKCDPNHAQEFGLSTALGIFSVTHLEEEVWPGRM